MGKKSKNSDKKQARLEREVARRRVVERLVGPNGRADGGSGILAPALMAYDGLGITFARADALDAGARAEVLDLLEANMRASYEASDWGWDASEKARELACDGARLRVARSAGGALAGFAHYRFEPDDDDAPARATLYVREIQVSASARGRGLGRRLMSLLHLIATTLELDCVMLTVFKANHRALAFYVDKLKYAADASDPGECGRDDADYRILSKPLPGPAKKTPLGATQG